MRMSLLAGCAVLLSVSALAAEPPAIPNESEHGFPAALAPAYITDLQQQLVMRGYYGGAVDGRMTGALRAAVAVYQSDVGLRVTGVPDLAVVNMLRYGPDVRATIQPLGQPLVIEGKVPATTPIAATPTAATPTASAPPAPTPPTAAPAVARGGVPPFEKIEPYRYPNPQAVVEAAAEEADAAGTGCCEGAVNTLKPPSPRPDRRALQVEEPPPPKPAPQARVVARPLSQASK